MSDAKTFLDQVKAILDEASAELSKMSVDELIAAGYATCKRTGRVLRSREEVEAVMVADATWSGRK